MSEGIEALLMEHMKSFRAGQARMERTLREVVSRVGQLVDSTAEACRDLARMAENLAAQSRQLELVDERLGRIEKRLDSRDAT